MTARRGIACAGNWIVDIVHSIDGWPRKSDLVHIRAETTGVGGGAANMALDLAAFATGLPVFPIGLVGRDLHGQTVLAALTARMRDEIVLQHAFVAIRDMTQFAQSDDRFHGLIAESAGCAAVLPELTRVKLHMDRFRHQTVSGVEDLPVVITQHESIAEAILSGDATEAETQMRGHLRRIFTSVVAAQVRYPEYFAEDRA